MLGFICLGLGHDPRMYPDSRLPRVCIGPDLPLTYREQPERILGTATDEPKGSELLDLLMLLLGAL